MSLQNKVSLKDKLDWTVVLHMHCRVREEQERKQLSQEQQLQEAKAEEAKRLDRQNQENKEKEQQTQLEKEVRGHYNPPEPHVVFEFKWGFDLFFNLSPSYYYYYY